MTTSTQTPNVLFVDDDPIIVELMTLLCDGEGFHLTTAFSAREALQILDTQTMDLIIADEDMPEMTGTEFMQLVKKHNPLQRIVALSAKQVIRSTDDELWFDRVALKPIEDYIGFIKECLGMDIEE